MILTKVGAIYELPLPMNQGSQFFCVSPKLI